MPGDIVREPHGPPILSTDLASIRGLTSFSESAGYLDGHCQPVSNMRSAVEELSRNLTISLLSSSVLEIALNATTSCLLETIRTVWLYDWWVLWLPYGMAIVATAVCLVIGALTMYGNSWEIYDNKSPR
jgi:hypothetical protein